MQISPQLISGLDWKKTSSAIAFFPARIPVKLREALMCAPENERLVGTESPSQAEQ